MNEEKINAINSVLAQYFAINKNDGVVPAKDLMPYFIKAGIFLKDHQNGFPIREILRKLDDANKLHRIPYVIAVRKTKNTNWFFCRQPQDGAQQIANLKTAAKKAKTAGRRKDSDEHYVIDLCDEVLETKGSRQHRFSFLIGDAGTRLPVDVYYDKLKLVVEYNEQQHTKAIIHFDKPDKLTVSGVHRGEQRKIYDQRKRMVLPQNGIRVIDIPYNEFAIDGKGKLIRDKLQDLKIVRQLLANYL